jgi:hypothetical protein
MRVTKQSHKLLFTIIISILVTILLVSGCNGNGVAEEPGPTTAAVEEETSQPPPTTPEATSEPPTSTEPPPTPTETEQPPGTSEPEIVVPYTQMTIGSRVNSLYYTGHGAYWGPNTIKTAATEDKIFTYVMDCSTAPWRTYLYSKEEGGQWQEGESLITGNPPNILIDSQGYIHLISFDRCLRDDFDDSWYGRIFHVKFDQPNTVSGTYSFEYITPDSRGTPHGPDQVANPYVGACIGEDDTIMVIYPNNIPEPPPFTLGVRIYNPDTEEWSYETVTENLPTRFCYPFGAVTDGYFHVLAIQDDIDETLPQDSPYRLGIIRHFQRARDSTEWVESTLIDFTEEIDTNPEVNDLLWLRNMDLFVDSSGIVHVMIRYNKNWSQGSSGEWKNTAYHYWKAEDATEWNSEQAIEEDCIWLKLWEREDGQLFYVYARMNQQIALIPFGTNQRYIISDLSPPYTTNPVPYITNPRSGTSRGTILKLIVFLETAETEAIYIRCDLSNL